MQSVPCGKRSILRHLETVLIRVLKMDVGKDAAAHGGMCKRVSCLLFADCGRDERGGVSRVPCAEGADSMLRAMHRAHRLGGSGSLQCKWRQFATEGGVVGVVAGAQEGAESGEVGKWGGGKF